MKHALFSSIAVAMCFAAGCGKPSAASSAADVGSAVAAAPGKGDVTAQADGTSTPVGPDSDQAAEQGAGSEPSGDREAVKVAAETPAAPQRPPADRTPTRPGDAEKISFDDLNLGMQADVVFRPFMITDRVKDLEGKRVSIAGYMHPGQLSQRGIKKFVLLKNTQCKFGPGGQADHLAQVLLQTGNTAEFTPGPVKVEGTLKVEAFTGVDGNTWAIYNLEEARMR